MVYNHIVKVNGVYYPAGTEVPEIEKDYYFDDMESESLYSDSEINLETEPVKRGRPKKN